MKFFNKKNLLFIAIFTLVGLVALQIPLTKLQGSRAAFTLYDAFAPISGAFIGTLPGIMAVFLMQILNFFLRGAEVLDAGTIIRFFPMLFATYYFAKKSKFNLVIPILAIISFLAHPVGREVWYFTAFWLIPIAMYFLRDKSLLARSLGATFSAHAVGGALWIWVFALPAEVWNSLIMLVIMERLLFTAGIAVSHVFVNNAIAVSEKKLSFNFGFKVDVKYLWPSLKNSYAPHTKS